MTTLERFWAKVDKTPGCWNWTGARTAVGWHGIFAINATRAEREMTLAHRFSWELRHGPIPEGMKVCHACDNPACVRPDHLWLGSQRANMVDAGRKGRLNARPVTCRQGHPFTAEITQMDRRTGRRRCLICRRASTRAAAARRRLGRAGG